MTVAAASEMKNLAQDRNTWNVSVVYPSFDEDRSCCW